MKEKLRIPSGAEGFAFQLHAPVLLRQSHHHRELEVNLVVSGRAAYLMGDERAPLAAGSMIWLFPRQEHVLIDCSPDFAMWVVVFTPPLVNRLTSLPARRALRVLDPGAIFSRQMEMRQVEALAAVYADATLGTSDQELANSALGYALLASWQAYTFSREPIAPSDVHPAVARAARLLASEEGTMLLPELARQAGLSAPRLSRLFHHQTGVTLTAFRQRQCLERFLRLYRTGKRYSLIEAALLAGFGSYPQFHRVFREGMGQSPGAYRRSLTP